MTTKTESQVALDLIDETPLNRRRGSAWGDLPGFARDIEARGVLQSILVRPVDGGRFELVVGARRVRASKLAKRTTIPAVVAAMTDAEVRETIFAENDQREDVHPLDESDLVHAMITEDGLSIDQVVAKTGKSRTWIARRLSYRDLGKKARQAFLDGTIEIGHAGLLSRIPKGALQDDALHFAQGGRHRDPPTVRSLQEWVERELMLALKGAPFDPADAELVPKAGACANCPKRTGASPDLFGDVESADVCTDPPCFQRKTVAAGKRAAADARRQGRTVLSEKAAAKVFYGGSHRGDDLRHGTPYVALSESCDDDPKRRTYQRLLGNDREAVVCAVAPSGALVELVFRKGLAQVLRDRGHDFRAAKRAAGPADPAAARRRETHRVRKETARRALQTLAGVRNTLDDFIGACVDGVIGRALNDAQKLVADRRELEAPKRHGSPDYDAALRAHARALGASGKRALVIELIAAGDAVGGEWSERAYGQAFRATCKRFRVNVDRIEKTVRAERAQARRKASKKAPKARARKKKTSKRKVARKKTTRRKAKKKA